jgi:hypothetical protein
MSHRNTCPDPYDARREGERAHDYGRGIYSNPYDAPFGDRGCDEAAEAWRRGYRDAEYRREEEDAEQRAAERRHQADLEEQRYLEEQYFAEQFPPEEFPPEPEPEEGGPES